MYIILSILVKPIIVDKSKFIYLFRSTVKYLIRFIIGNILRSAFLYLTAKVIIGVKGQLKSYRLGISISKLVGKNPVELNVLSC